MGGVGGGPTKPQQEKPGGSPHCWSPFSCCFPCFVHFKADHKPPSTSVLPHSQAKSMLHTSNPIICYLQGQGPGWKPCLPVHPSSTKDHKAVQSLLQWGPWWQGDREHPGVPSIPTHRIGHCEPS